MQVTEHFHASQEYKHFQTNVHFYSFLLVSYFDRAHMHNLSQWFLIFLWFSLRTKSVLRSSIKANWHFLLKTWLCSVNTGLSWTWYDEILCGTEQTFLACTFCFPSTDHVMILRRFDPLSCSLKRVHASMNMSACTLFSEQDKGSNLLRIVAGPVLGKQNVQAGKVYFCKKTFSFATKRFFEGLRRLIVTVHGKTYFDAHPLDWQTR